MVAVCACACCVCPPVVPVARVCQVNIKSLEDVVRRYLQLAETKTEEARNESHQTIVDVDDLDVIQTPEK